jgi:hypothetical protein
VAQRAEARGLIGLGRPPAPLPPPRKTADRPLLSPVTLGFLVQVIVIAVKDHLARESAGELGRTPPLHDGNVPLPPFPAVTEPGLRGRSQDTPPPRTWSAPERVDVCAYSARRPRTVVRAAGQAFAECGPGRTPPRSISRSRRCAATRSRRAGCSYPPLSLLRWRITDTLRERMDAARRRRRGR